MISLILAVVAATNAYEPALSAEGSDRQAETPELRLHFWDEQDVFDTYGHLVFQATPLEDLGRPTGYPEGMAFACTAPREAGGMWVYGWTCHDDKGEFHETNPLRVVRCWTDDGKVFQGARTVFTDDTERWLSFANIVRRPTDGMLFMFPWARKRGKRAWGHALLAYTSSDGENWRQLAAPVYHDHDAFSVFWDARSEQFVNVQTTYQAWKKKYPDNLGDARRRVLSIRTSRDGVRWDPTGDLAFSREPLTKQLWTPDEQDPQELELYRIVAFPHQGRFVGILCLYAPSPQVANTRKGTKHGPGLGGQWCFSRDGRTWVRPDRQTDAIARVGFMPHQGPLCANGVLHFYRHMDPVIAGVSQDRIFCVYYRANGEFSSRPFTMPAGDLRLNAAANQYDSYVMAELLDEHGKVIQGFEKDKCVHMGMDEAGCPLRWDGRSAQTLKGRTVRIRLYFRNARIYGLTG